MAGFSVICAAFSCFGRGKTPRPEVGASVQQQSLSAACVHVWAMEPYISKAWSGGADGSLLPYCWQRRKKAILKVWSYLGHVSVTLSSCLGRTVLKQQMLARHLLVLSGEFTRNSLKQDPAFRLGREWTAFEGPESSEVCAGGWQQSLPCKVRPRCLLTSNLSS